MMQRTSSCSSSRSRLCRAKGAAGGAAGGASLSQAQQGADLHLTKLFPRRLELALQNQELRLARPGPTSREAAPL